MRIGIVGKLPPIQGGVAMRTWRYAHALAGCGHDVAVITNAREVAPPHRAFMRSDDWARCEAEYGTGRVRVFWTDPVDRSQRHIPMASPYVSKLVSLGLAANDEVPFDVLLSYYLEPYAVAGHLIAEAARCPHVVKTAGSDAGQLWRHPQLQPVYRHVFRAAEAVICAAPLADALAADGIDSSRLLPERDFRVDETLFTPGGPALDVAALLAEAGEDPAFATTCRGRYDPARRYVGLYGKLGPTKGLAPLLDALAGLPEAGLLLMGQGRSEAAEALWANADSLGIAERIVQLPFLPPWRVPEFIRRCVAVCCLEQGFPISFHVPVTPREVLGCGRCLVASLELVAKLPFAERMVDGYNGAVLADAHDADAIRARLAAILAESDRADAVARRGRAAFEVMERAQSFPDRIEAILRRAAARGHGGGDRPVRAAPHMPLVRLAAAALGDAEPAEATDTAVWAHRVLARLEEADADDARLAALADGVRLELAIAEAARGDCAAPDGAAFRLAVSGWGIRDDELDALSVAPARRWQALRLDHDANALLRARAAGSFDAVPERCASHVAVLSDAGGARALVLTEDAMQVLDACRSGGTLGALCARLGHLPAGEVRDRAVQLFELGVLALDQQRA